MNWTKIFIGGCLGGVAVWLYSFLMHGVILAGTYTDHPAFQQAESNPFTFLLVSVAIGIAGTALFARSRASWAPGIKGGATFGFFVGLVALFLPFYLPLVINAFPYYLGWCWGTIDLIGWMIYGVVASLIVKAEAAS
jgi:hypothetical protein